VSFDLVSEHPRPVEVTVAERLPSELSVERVGFHPGYGAEGWTCYDGGELVWRGRLDPDERQRIVFGVWLDSPESAVSLLRPPSIESVRTVAEASDPLVLDDAFLSTPHPGLADLRQAVEGSVPSDSLRGSATTATRFADLPDSGDALSAPSQSALDGVVDAVVGGAAAGAHDRYYHLRLAVEAAGREERGVSVLEDLTNALSVLHADADDRDGGAWRVLDVAIGTNWQAERIVTALGDDHRISGLLVTELTGAVTAGGRRRADRTATHEEPNPAELATTLFDMEPSSEPTGVTDSRIVEDDFGVGTAGDFDGFEDFEPATVVECPPAEEPAPSEDDRLTDESHDAISEDGMTEEMAMFAALQDETEQAGVEELDEELEDVVLSPTDEEEFSIADLLASVESEGERPSA
jgi:hypothetical protein